MSWQRAGILPHDPEHLLGHSAISQPHSPWDLLGHKETETLAHAQESCSESGRDVRTTVSMCVEMSQGQRRWKCLISLRLSHGHLC